MKHKPEKHQFISYLYGELSEEEKVRFEAYLRQDPQSAKEVGEMAQLLGQLDQWPDVEAPEPPVLIIPPVAEAPEVAATTEVGAKELQKPHWVMRLSQGVALIAASLALLLVVGYLTRMEMEYQAGDFRLRFGDQSSSALPDGQQAILTELQALRKEVKQSGRMVNPETVSRLTGQEIQELKMTLARLEKQMESRMPTSERVKYRHRPVVRQSLNEDQFNQLVNQISRENFRLVEQAFEAANEEQQAQLYQALNQFARHLDQIRAEDTQMVMASLEELDQKAERKFQETDQALDVLIQSVQSQPQQ